MLELKKITENYRNYDDIKIHQIARNESKGLRAEVIPILIAEIERRNFGSQLIEWVKAENRKLTKDKLEDLKSKVKNAPCFSCGEKGKQLKGFEFTTLIGFFIISSRDDYSLILCRKCGIKKRRKSGIQTIFFGWWSFEGILTTPLELISKIKAASYEDQESEKIIENFIRNNIGTITLKHDSKEVISSILKKYNESNYPYSNVDLLI